MTRAAVIVVDFGVSRYASETRMAPKAANKTVNHDVAEVPRVHVKILINASTLVVGGGIQIGRSFIEYASRLDEREFKLAFVVSQAVYRSLPLWIQDDHRLQAVTPSPARILRGHASRAILKRLELEFAPDLVYTLGLPSYTRFRTIEVGRYTNPWEIHPSALALSMIPLRERLMLRLKTHYRMFWARRATYFETQTEAAKAGIVKRLRIPAEVVKVIPSCPNQMFLDVAERMAEERSIGDRALIFCLAAPYRHKHLTIIPEVARWLKDRCKSRGFSFVTTLPEGDRINDEISQMTSRLGVGDMVTNVGPLTLEECVQWYRRADLVFLPTLLEVFSATYIEAMAMSKPIVTSDLDFARAVCGDAAMYYEPASARAAAEAISMIVEDTGLRRRLVERGKRRLSTFPAADEKHRMVFDWLRDIAVNNRH